MILEKQTEATVLQEGVSQDSIGMSLDLDSAQILMQMLSKNLYSDSIGSTIRECASNALDSHRRAGVDKPIIVSFKENSTYNYEFCVEDFGIGLDADDVRNIISKYGKSTKRNSNTELGMMGLGFKAPLAYSSSFYFTCRKDGVERKYMMYEGEDTNTIDLLYETPTTEDNGVKIIIPVNFSDRNIFIEKIQEQLAYFESVYFDVSTDIITNNFKIYRNTDYQFSDLVTTQYMHISLDNVYYPIDFDKLKIAAIRFPVALRFSLSDGLFPTPNRESIRYTKEAIDIILAKIKTVADLFVNKYNNINSQTNDIYDVIEFYNSSTRNVDITNDGVIHSIKTLIDHSSIHPTTPTFKDVKLLNFKKICENRENWLRDYKVNVKFHKGKTNTIKDRYCYEFQIKNLKSSVCYIYTEKLTGLMKDYIKSISHHSVPTLLIKKDRSMRLGSPWTTTLFSYDTYTSQLELSHYPKNEWRQRITEFQSVINSITDRFINVDTITIPQSFIDSRKKLRVSSNGSTYVGRAPKLKGEIIGKQATQLLRYMNGKNCKWEPTTYSLENIHKTPGLCVYGGVNDVDQMDKLFGATDSKRIRFVQFSDRELVNLKKVNVHNWMSLEKFMKGDNKLFKQVVTSRLIHELKTLNRDVFEKRIMMDKVSSDLYNKIEKLDVYRRTHHQDASQALYEAMLEIAEANNLYDVEMYTIYLEVKTILDRLPFLQTLFNKINNYAYSGDTKMISVIVDLCKYYEQRVNLSNYKLSLNEDLPLENELTEDTVEELLTQD